MRAVIANAVARWKLDRRKPPEDKHLKCTSCGGVMKAVPREPGKITEWLCCSSCELSQIGAIA